MFIVYMYLLNSGDGQVEIVLATYLKVKALVLELGYYKFLQGWDFYFLLCKFYYPTVANSNKWKHVRYN